MDEGWTPPSKITRTKKNSHEQGALGAGKVSSIAAERAPKVLGTDALGQSNLTHGLTPCQNHEYLRLLATNRKLTNLDTKRASSKITQKLTKPPCFVSRFCTDEIYLGTKLSPKNHCLRKILNSMKKNSGCSQERVLLPETKICRSTCSCEIDSFH